MMTRWHLSVKNQDRCVQERRYKASSIIYIFMHTLCCTMMTNKINKGECRKLKKVLFLCLALFISICLVACGEAVVKELDNIEENTRNSKDDEDQDETRI